MAANTGVKQQIQFDAIKIGLASPDKIREWSHGEVKKPETINYRTLKPERDGLYCERIFGPTKDWECHCGKYKRIRYKGVICDRCGVEVTRAKVRRERMGHIELACPVSHIWYFKGIPSRMGLMLDIPPRTLEKVLYFAAYIVLDPGDSTLQYKQLLTEAEYRQELANGSHFRAQMGAEAIQELLRDVDLEKESRELSEELVGSSGQKRIRILKRLEVIDSFIKSGNRPEWMVMDVVPVIPPDLRPMVQLDGGRFATSDLNDLYRRVINRNNRLKRLLQLNAPDIIVRNEKRMLQEAVDALIDNGRRGRSVVGPANRALKSLSDMLRGKQGRFRQNLLGKRVDYSGRSVIVVGPSLKLYQCGLPKEMAIELFKPFVMKKLCEKGFATNIKSAKRMVERLDPVVWDVLEGVIHEHPVMLNRAPTLHRLGIQAFEPVLVEGKAICLHPLACAAFNADFDGDQMAVHVPLSVEAQAECRFMLLSTNNLLKPSDGAPVTVPSQDMVLGSYYLTRYDEETVADDEHLRRFKDKNEALNALVNEEITLNTPVMIRRTVTVDGQTVSGMVKTSPGRIIFNEKVPQDLGYVKRDPARPETYLPYEVDFVVGKKALGQILHRCILVHGITDTTTVLDDVKALGYKYCTLSGMTFSAADVKIPSQKSELIAKSEAEVNKLVRNYRRGTLTNEERHRQVIKVWENTIKALEDLALPALGEKNNIYMFIDSGARGSKDQLKQMTTMRGLTQTPQGETIELPIKSCFKEGLDVLEYFVSAHGTRKGLTDTALRTADSGYLTRRLVDVSQDIIIRAEDCCTNGEQPEGVWVSAFIIPNLNNPEKSEVIETLAERITGRWAIDEIVDPATGEVIVPADTMITSTLAEKVEAAGIEKVHIRNLLTCRQRLGVCAKCYGANMSNGLPVRLGEAVGIIAAQSIGEPGTQLTMRTFHTGGVSGSEDITQGLPRVQELFEARKPRGQAIISEIAGEVSQNFTKRKRELVVTSVTDGTAEAKSYAIPYGATLKVKDGDIIEAGAELTEGSVNPHDILRIRGLEATQNYMISEVQRVYRQQGVDINDKHIETIVRQMLRKIRITDNGDTEFMPGSLVDYLDFDAHNKQMREAGKAEAQGERVLLGITKAALATESFMSAASFQETTRVLTEAAIKGKIDPLIGLKENVIIGKLIPAGTGMQRYQDLDIEKNLTPEELAAIEAAKQAAAEEAAKLAAEKAASQRAGAEDEDDGDTLELIMDDGEEGETLDLQLFADDLGDESDDEFSIVPDEDA
ncbi:MAG: DNA-directed RNA polymerase subunit beta' [Firmicutes bacterium]|nr:DNA-directed RNA polymerase subunit beta' [Bacillota bacterium]